MNLSTARGKPPGSLIRDDLRLSTMRSVCVKPAQFLGNLIEPGLFILGDVWKRKTVVIGGGIVFYLAMLLMSASSSFWLLMPPSFLFIRFRAFVSLSQARLWTSTPTATTEHGALDVCRVVWASSSGSLMLGGMILLDLGWRELFLSANDFFTAAGHFRRPIPYANGTIATADESEPVTFRTGVRNAIHALRHREVLRWLTLLQFSDLMLDVLHGYLALYMVDVVGVEKRRPG